MVHLPSEGFLRLKDILGDSKSTPPIPAIIPVCKTTWYEGIKTGRYPKPIRLSQRSSAWRVEDIRQLIDEVTA